MCHSGISTYCSGCSSRSVHYGWLESASLPALWKLWELFWLYFFFSSLSRLVEISPMNAQIWIQPKAQGAPMQISGTFFCTVQFSLVRPPWTLICFPQLRCGAPLRCSCPFAVVLNLLSGRNPGDCKTQLLCFFFSRIRVILFDILCLKTFSFMFCTIFCLFGGEK